MAWQKISFFNDGAMQDGGWYNPETGETSYQAQMPSAASGQVANVGSYGGEGSGGTEFRYVDTGSGQAVSDQNAAAAQYTKQLDDAFQQVINNPNASSWDKAMAVQTRYGVESLAQLANQGYFQDIASQLGPHIAARQAEGNDKGFTVGGNALGVWPVVGGMLAGSLLAGSAAGGASGAASEGAATGATAQGTSAGVSASAGGEFTGGLTGTAAGSPGLTAGGFNAANLGAGGASATPGLAVPSAGISGAGALSAGSFAGESLYPVAGGLSSSAGATSLGSASMGASAPAASSASSGLLSNPSLVGGLAGAGLGALSGTGSKQGTIQTEEGIPDWLMPYVKPTLDKYSTDVQNYNVDPYGIMPSAMQQFQKTIQGDFLSPDSNPYLNDYFRLGAERIKGSLSPTFGHMQAFGQHSGYNEALARGLGDFGVQLYGGAYNQERERQNQLTAAAPAFLGQNSQAQFQPFSQYLSSVGSLGKSKESPFFTNPFSSILGGAMVGSQFGKMF